MPQHTGSLSNLLAPNPPSNYPFLQGIRWLSKNFPPVYLSLSFARWCKVVSSTPSTSLCLLGHLWSSLTPDLDGRRRNPSAPDAQAHLSLPLRMFPRGDHGRPPELVSSLSSSLTPLAFPVEAQRPSTISRAPSTGPPPARSYLPRRR